jgi:hypothetical protein
MASRSSLEGLESLDHISTGMFSPGTVMFGSFGSLPLDTATMPYPKLFDGSGRRLVR